MSDMAKYRSRYIKSEELKRTGDQTREITGYGEASLRDPKTNGSVIKPVLEFDDRALVLNATLLDFLFEAFKSTDGDDWIGHQVEIYFDPSVKFGNDTRGGIRLRLPESEIF